MEGLSYSISILDNSCDEDNFNTLVRGISRDRVSLVRSKSNIGYSRGINLSVDWSADYVVLLNPDVIVSDQETWSEVISILDADESVGVVGVAQVNDDGSVAEVARRFPSLRKQVLRRLLKSEKEYSAIQVDNSFGVCEVDWLQSSFWVMRGEVWRALEGLDERFFLFMADPDFCLRAFRMGYKSLLYSKRKSLADGRRASSGGVGSIVFNAVLRVHIVDMIRYYIKQATGK
jgi:GT2 family glycosyltransferase